MEGTTVGHEGGDTLQELPPPRLGKLHGPQPQRRKRWCQKPAGKSEAPRTVSMTTPGADTRRTITLSARIPETVENPFESLRVLQVPGRQLPQGTPTLENKLWYFQPNDRGVEGDGTRVSAQGPKYRVGDGLVPGRGGVSVPRRGHEKPSARFEKVLLIQAT